MRKQVLFSAMLFLGTVTGLTFCPAPAMASVQQDQTIKVGHNATLGTLQPDGCTNERLSILINNLTTDLDGLVLLHRCHSWSRTER